MGAPNCFSIKAMWRLPVPRQLGNIHVNAPQICRQWSTSQKYSPEIAERETSLLYGARTSSHTARLLG